MSGYLHSEPDLLHGHIPDMRSISLLTLTYQKDVVAALTRLTDRSDQLKHMD